MKTILGAQHTGHMHPIHHPPPTRGGTFPGVRPGPSPGINPTPSPPVLQPAPNQLHPSRERHNVSIFGVDLGEKRWGIPTWGWGLGVLGVGAYFLTRKKSRRK
jgi:hypothetical protein